MRTVPQSADVSRAALHLCVERCSSRSEAHRLADVPARYDESVFCVRHCDECWRIVGAASAWSTALASRRWTTVVATETCRRAVTAKRECPVGECRMAAA